MANPSAVLYGPTDVRIEDRATPVVGPEQVLVAVQAVGICGSDVHYFEHGRIGPHVVTAPMVIGHEAAGTVLFAGGEADQHKVGLVVALEPGVPCRRCQQCVLGRYNLCPHVVFFATPPHHGAIAQYVAIDAAFAHVAPRGMTAERAAMAEPTSVGIWACRRVGVVAGDRVLVSGAGPVGLLAAQVARAFSQVVPVVTDISDARLKVARRLGLEGVQAGSLDPGRSFDVLIECSGAPRALDQSMPRLAPRGRVALVGMGSDQVRLDLPLVQDRELSVSGVFRYAHTYPLALQLIDSGVVQVDPIISHRFGLAGTSAALSIGRTDPHALKVIVRPDDG